IVAMLLGYALVFYGATLVAEGWMRIHQARRSAILMTDGIYAHVRHPQYMGLFLIVFGEGVVHWPTIVSVLAFPIIVFAYTMLARKEERQMLAQFGDDYRAYQRHVPMFFPRISTTQQQES
ncbi:isoprenylcysteine carboxylmethyltransferase family protein, partial [Litorivivens sp.]|uniref:methyltransferase family protein n=1 Tax=Litorivivens sp. TaxID=2020868 RepID=UPI00356280EA